MKTILKSLSNAVSLKTVKDNVDPFAFETTTKLPSGSSVPCVRMSTWPTDAEAKAMVGLGFRENTPIHTPSGDRNGRDWYLPFDVRN